MIGSMELHAKYFNRFFKKNCTRPIPANLQVFSAYNEKSRANLKK